MVGSSQILKSKTSSGFPIQVAGIQVPESPRAVSLGVHQLEAGWEVKYLGFEPGSSSTLTWDEASAAAF